jgi:hypothetical protein
MTVLNHGRRLLKAAYRHLPVIRELNAIRHEQARQTETIIGIANTFARDWSPEKSLSDPLRLFGAESQVNSQNGEDGIICEIFSRIGVTNKACVEIGAGDGVENNTAFLASLGWEAWMVDGRYPEGCHLHRSHGRAPHVRRVGMFVTRESVNELMRSLGVPAEPDLVSIDVDQNTYHIWDGLVDLRPRVVVIEYNSSIPPDVAWVPSYCPDRVWDGTTNYSASLESLVQLGRKKGMHLVGCDYLGINAFFIRDDLVAGKFSAPFTARHHYQPPRYWLATRWFHRRQMLDCQAESP